MSHPPSLPDGPQDRGFEPGGYLVPSGEQPPRTPSPGARLGRVSGVSVRQEAQRHSSSATPGLTVLELRLLEPGNPRPLDVLLRGRSLSGTVRDGDWVEVAGPPDATGRWNVARVQNLTTGATVVVLGGRPSRTGTAAGLVLLGLMAVVVVLVVVGFVAALASS